MAGFQLDVATPEKTVYSSLIDMVIVTTVEGEVGVLPGHAPLTTLMSAGPVRVKKDEKTVTYQASDGMLMVRDHSVHILTRTWESDKQSHAPN